MPCERQQAGFEAERQRWRAEGLDSFVVDGGHSADTEGAIPAGCVGLPTTVPGDVWKVVKAVGDRVAIGEAVVIIETMKMETAITASAAGLLIEIRVQPGRTVRGGDLIAVIEES